MGYYKRKNYYWKLKKKLFKAIKENNKSDIKKYVIKIKDFDEKYNKNKLLKILEYCCKTINGLNKKNVYSLNKDFYFLNMLYEKDKLELEITNNLDMKLEERQQYYYPKLKLSTPPLESKDEVQVEGKGEVQVEGEELVATLALYDRWQHKLIKYKKVTKDKYYKELSKRYKNEINKMKNDMKKNNLELLHEMEKNAILESELITALHHLVQ